MILRVVVLLGSFAFFCTITISAIGPKCPNFFAECAPFSASSCRVNGVLHVCVLTERVHTCVQPNTMKARLSETLANAFVLASWRPHDDLYVGAHVYVRSMSHLWRVCARSHPVLLEGFFCIQHGLLRPTPPLPSTSTLVLLIASHHIMRYLTYVLVAPRPPSEAPTFGVYACIPETLTSLCPLIPAFLPFHSICAPTLLQKKYIEARANLAFPNGAFTPVVVRAVHRQFPPGCLYDVMSAVIKHCLCYTALFTRL